jgi:deoxyguanosine kinase
MTSEQPPATPPVTSPPAENPAPVHRFIVLEGPIGVGKTTLAGKLAETLGAELVLERADNNPFLERFYRNPRAGALAAQLYFLFQRTQQLSALQQHDMFAPMRIADYLIDKDRLFARTTLDDEEYRLYEQVYARLAIEAPKPDLVIYLERLNDAYARFFHEYEASPLLIVNAAAIDPVNSEADFAELLAAIQRMRRGRLYYNPLRHGAL